MVRAKVTLDMAFDVFCVFFGLLMCSLAFFPSRPRNIMVYNCTTGGTNPFHWSEVGMPYFFFF